MSVANPNRISIKFQQSNDNDKTELERSSIISISNPV